MYCTYMDLISTPPENLSSKLSGQNVPWKGILKTLAFGIVASKSTRSLAYTLKQKNTSKHVENSTSWGMGLELMFGVRQLLKRQFFFSNLIKKLKNIFLFQFNSLTNKGVFPEFISKDIPDQVPQIRTFIPVKYFLFILVKKRWNL